MAGNARRRAERRKRNKAKRREVKDMRHCIAKDMKHGVRTYKDNGKSEDSNSGKSKDSNKEIPRNDLPHGETISEDDADGVTRSDQEQDDKTITNPDYVKGRTRSNSGDSNDSEQIDKNALNVDNGIDDDTTREIFNTPEDMEMDTESEEDINDEHFEPMNNTENCKSANDSSGINMEDPKNMTEKNMGSSVFPGACTPLHYFMSVANRIQTQLCNIPCKR
ncbi:uncharacterized protein LOC103520756 [Diaphorina citri]|uniref:Uncharacterized protein LOC103520756 n=1 Tax=Diaphorina citri TaxID=121845 RepID=A0A1S3DMQ8_DIACI|nr:uncharacterized protein LOC103520756 [Diaphorina citri]